MRGFSEEEQITISKKAERNIGRDLACQLQIFLSLCLIRNLNFNQFSE